MHIGLFGLSGSGKTTLTKLFSTKHAEYTGTSASSLLQSSGQETNLARLDSKNLKNNQDVLIEAYKKLKKGKPDTIIELHAVIETEQSPFWVPMESLRKLELDMILFLMADPLEIKRRRAIDTSKKRKTADTKEIDALQKKALDYVKSTYHPMTVFVLKDKVALSELEAMLYRKSREIL